MSLGTSLEAHHLNSFSAINITRRINLFLNLCSSNKRPLIYDHNKVKRVALVVVLIVSTIKIKP